MKRRDLTPGLRVAVKTSYDPDNRYPREAYVITTDPYVAPSGFSLRARPRPAGPGDPKNGVACAVRLTSSSDRWVPEVIPTVSVLGPYDQVVRQAEHTRQAALNEYRESQERATRHYQARDDLQARTRALTATASVYFMSLQDALSLTPTVQVPLTVLARLVELAEAGALSLTAPAPEDVS